MQKKIPKKFRVNARDVDVVFMWGIPPVWLVPDVSRCPMGPVELRSVEQLLDNLSDRGPDWIAELNYFAQLVCYLIFQQYTLCRLVRSLRGNKIQNIQVNYIPQIYFQYSINEVH